jgi:hypothetical protein
MRDMSVERTGVVFLAGAATAALGCYLFNGHKKTPVDKYAEAKGKVWNSIGGAMQVTQVYIGDKLGLYAALRELCADGKSTTATVLANKLELSTRWVREWMAQQGTHRPSLRLL